MDTSAIPRSRAQFIHKAALARGGAGKAADLQTRSLHGCCHRIRLQIYELRFLDKICRHPSTTGAPIMDYYVVWSEPLWVLGEIPLSSGRVVQRRRSCGNFQGQGLNFRIERHASSNTRRVAAEQVGEPDKPNS
ncbi:hypothetical protein AAE478_004873 [Parahypoxylon ruwenzoriense]